MMCAQRATSCCRFRASVVRVLPLNGRAHCRVSVVRQAASWHTTVGDARSGANFEGAEVGAYVFRPRVSTCAVKNLPPRDVRENLACPFTSSPQCGWAFVHSLGVCDRGCMRYAANGERM